MYISAFQHFMTVTCMALSDSLQSSDHSVFTKAFLGRFWKDNWRGKGRLSRKGSQGTSQYLRFLNSWMKTHIDIVNDCNFHQGSGTSEPQTGVYNPGMIHTRVIQSSPGVPVTTSQKTRITRCSNPFPESSLDWTLTSSPLININVVPIGSSHCPVLNPK